MTITSVFCQLISSKSIIHRPKLPVSLKHQRYLVSGSFLYTCILFLKNSNFCDKSPIILCFVLSQYFILERSIGVILLLCFSSQCYLNYRHCERFWSIKWSRHPRWLATIRSLGERRQRDSKELFQWNHAKYVINHL